MAKLIEILVSPTGEATVQTKGYLGDACVPASRWLEQALGLATQETKTAEFYQSQPVQQEVHE